MKKLLLLSALLIFACSSDSEGNPCVYEPTLSTEAITDITESSATLNGIIAIVSENCEVAPGEMQGFVYSTNPSPTNDDSVEVVYGTDISTTIDNLTPNTTYYVRVFITNNLGEFYGNEMEFTTTAEASLFNCDGNPVPTIIYGTQEWTVENACYITYRDGTPIPEVTDPTEWANLTTGAWTYSFNEFNVTSKLYNWYAIEGIHDNNPNTPNKEFSPEGWHVPSDDEWTTLQDFLVDNGHSYNLSCGSLNYEVAVAKAMASTSGWDEVAEIWDDWDKTPGGNQILNNSSGFNALPVGAEFGQADGYVAIFWTSTREAPPWDEDAYYLEILSDYVCTDRDSVTLSRGYSVRLVKD